MINKRANPYHHHQPPVPLSCTSRAMRAGVHAHATPFVRMHQPTLPLMQVHARRCSRTHPRSVKHTAHSLSGLFGICAKMWARRCDCKLAPDPMLVAELGAINADVYIAVVLMTLWCG